MMKEERKEEGKGFLEKGVDGDGSGSIGFS
jgi:hypothetical protein